MTPHMKNVSSSSSGASHLLDLSAVIVHEGDSLNFGHYYALIRPDPTNAPNLWFKANDHIVTALSTEEVLRIASGGAKKCNVSGRLCSRLSPASSAYLVMYTKQK